jgi:hypothetical protein
LAFRLQVKAAAAVPAIKNSVIETMLNGRRTAQLRPLTLASTAKRAYALRPPTVLPNQCKIFSPAHFPIGYGVPAASQEFPL